MSASIFERYPQLSTLRELLSDSEIERAIVPGVDEFELWRRRARERIPTVKLSERFPGELEKTPIRLANFLGHWGNISVESVCKLCLMVAYLQPGKIFEFGTYNGMTTLQMALNSPQATEIYTLDLARGAAATTKHQLSELDRLVAEVFPGRFSSTTGCYFQGTVYAGKIRQLFGDSARFDFSPYCGAMDLVYIDAAHDYDNKKCDSENALKLISDSGVIVWDNYDDVVNPDVTRYLCELAETLPLFHLRGTAFVVYRKGV